MESRAGLMRGKTPGEIMIDRRKELGLTQEDLEWESGVSSRQIGNIENNKHKPAFETIERLERALGIPLMEEFIAYWRRTRTEEEKQNVTRQAVRKLERELVRRKLNEEQVQAIIDKTLADVENLADKDSDEC